MRKFISGAFAATLLVAACAFPAMAAGPDHETIRDTFADPDFCGTGKTVDATVTGAFNGFGDRAVGHVRTTWTNPANGIGVYDSFSGGGAESFIDDGGGAYTLALTRQGQPLRLQYVNGPVIIRDAGLIIVYNHFDADDNYLGTEIAVENGPHPGRALDWCVLMVDALQL